MADVTVTLAAHHQGHAPGDRITVDSIEAKRLLHAGVAAPSTVPDAKAAGIDAAEAATKR